MNSLPHLPPAWTKRFGSRFPVRVFAFCAARIAAASASVFLMIAMSAEHLHAQAAGICIYKESSAHPDGSAKVFEYTMIRNLGDVTHYFMPDGRKVEFTKFQTQTSVAYPELMSLAITNPEQLRQHEKALLYYRGIATRYPRAAPFLGTHLQIYDDMVRRVKEGQVLFNGEWMSRTAYDALVKREEGIANERRDKSTDKKRGIEEQARRLAIETRRHKR